MWWLDNRMARSYWKQCDYGTTILSAIKNTVHNDTEVVYKENPSLNYVKSNNFSYAIVVVGEKPYAEQNRPVVIQPYVDKIEALVAAWLPGTEGSGVTDVLFGDYVSEANFQGHGSKLLINCQ
ncbi:uncharacterized protein [Phaseolus vulgaris]|uniref:uncharacterized protein n=1 Tax=Phaseolus vulgaris TaxID=3885 RepID=UPI0035CA9089